MKKGVCGRRRVKLGEAAAAHDAMCNTVLYTHAHQMHPPHRRGVDAIHDHGPVTVQGSAIHSERVDQKNLATQVASRL